MELQYAENTTGSTVVIDGQSFDDSSVDELDWTNGYLDGGANAASLAAYLASGDFTGYDDSQSAMTAAEALASFGRLFDTKSGLCCLECPSYGMLKRTDTGVAEIIREGVEYYAKDVDAPGKQSYIQYFSSGAAFPVTTWTVIGVAISGATALCPRAQAITVSQTTTRLLIADGGSDNNNVLLIRQKSDNTALEVHAGSWLAGSNSFSGWCRYTKD